MTYLVAYSYPDNTDLFFYRFTADDAEHAIEQFRSAEPSAELTVVFVTKV